MIDKFKGYKKDKMLKIVYASDNVNQTIQFLKLLYQNKFNLENINKKDLVINNNSSKLLNFFYCLNKFEMQSQLDKIH